MARRLEERKLQSKSTLPMELYTFLLVNHATDGEVFG